MAKNNKDNSTTNTSHHQPRRRGHGPGQHLGMPIVRAKDATGTLKRLLKYLASSKRVLLSIFVLVIVTSLLRLSGPYLIGFAIDNYILPGDFRGLLMITMLLTGIYIFGSCITWVENYLMIGLAQTTVRNMRKELFDKIQILPLKYFDSTTHGELMSRLANDIENISQILTNSITQVFSSFITIIGVFIVMLYLSPILTVVTLVIIPLMALVTKKIATFTRTYFSKQQQNLGTLNGFIEETISGQRVIKVFTHEKSTINQFAIHNEELKKVSIWAQILSGFIGPFMNVLNNVSFALVAGVGGWLVVNQRISIGVIASFINYSRQFTRPINQLANLFNMIQAALAGAERVFEILDEESEPEDSNDAIELIDIIGEVRFANVSFAYEPDTPVLKNIDIEAHPGQTIALVGPTGAGKTTIINLLTRFYDIDQGTITIDGYDIRTIKRDNLRSLLGIVLQDTYLFSESVKENIRYGRLDATDSEIEAAAKLANAHQFITRLPDGYNTVLSEDGSNLSQGQRQLLAIARAVLADPAILILDEATSSVDTRTEQHIQEAMLTLMKGRTNFVIAHRLSTIKDADLIAVINEGCLVEKGTHQQLLDQKGFYHDLYMSQFSKQAS